MIEFEAISVAKFIVAEFAVIAEVETEPICTATVLFIVIDELVSAVTPFESDNLALNEYVPLGYFVVSSITEYGELDDEPTSESLR